MYLLYILPILVQDLDRRSAAWAFHPVKEADCLTINGSWFLPTGLINCVLDQARSSGHG